MSEDSEKLIDILKQNNVRMSTKGNICLYGFVKNIVGSKNPKLYVRKLSDYNKIIINDKPYISLDDCIDILKNTNFKRCKDIYTKIQINNGDNTSIIDVNQKIFQFDGHKFLAFFVKKDDYGDWDVFVKGSEIAKYLEYVDTEKAIQSHVDNENKISFFKLCELFEPVFLPGQKNIDKKTIFINLSGFLNLIHFSKKPFAKKIRQWLDNTVVPELIKYGTYTMQPKKLQFEFFYDENRISDFDGHAVIYIAYVGKYDGVYIFKFGLSRDVFSREYNKHRKSFDQFKVLFIAKCDNCEQVEKLFKKDLKIRNLYRRLTIKNKYQTELFTITTKFTHDYFIDLMQKLINDHKLPAIKDADNKINNLCNVVDTYKQSDEIKKLELQYKLSDNYKLELHRDIKKSRTDIKINEINSERDVKIKEIVCDADIAIKNIYLKIECEKSKQLAMNKGYDLTHFIDNVIQKPLVKSKKKSNILVL